MYISLQTILEKLVALTETINTIKTNAKKINELPAQSVLDPGSEIHVSKTGNRKIGNTKDHKRHKIK
jgi:hypothetical protein